MNMRRELSTMDRRIWGTAVVSAMLWAILLVAALGFVVGALL
jgi:hypothetical protein